MDTICKVYKYCHNCRFWEWDDNVLLPNGEVGYPGHCGLWSGACINSVTSNSINTPPNFLSMEDAFLNEADTAVV